MLNVWSEFISRIRHSIDHRNLRGGRVIRRIRRRRGLRTHERLEDRTLLSAAIIVNEGEIAYNTGTFSGILPEDVDGSTIQTNVGSVSWNSGTGVWSWQFSAIDGPDDSQHVLIAASSTTGTPLTPTEFDLVVNNLAPDVQGPAPAIVSNPTGLPVGNNPSNLVSANGFVYFEADDPATGGRSFFVNDGTHVIDLSAQSPLYLGSSLFYGPTVARIGNKIFFVARRNDGSGLGSADVYCYEAGTVTNLTATSGPGDVLELAAVGNTLYISGATSQFELWKYDGSGLSLDIPEGSLTSISNLTPGDDELFFAGNYPTQDLYRWDGTTLSNITAGTGVRVSGQPEYAAGSVYFRDQNSELRRYDGTSIANLSQTVLSGYSLVDFAVANGQLVVHAGTSSVQSYFLLDGSTLTDLLEDTGLSSVGSQQFFGTEQVLYFQAVRLSDPTATLRWFKREGGTIQELPDWGSARFDTLVGDGQGGVVGTIHTPDFGIFHLVGFSNGRLRNLTPLASLPGVLSGAVAHGSDLYFTRDIQTYSPYSATSRTNRLLYRFDGVQVYELTGISVPGYYSNVRYGFEDLEILSTDATGVYFTGTDADNGVTGLWRVEGTTSPVLITAQFVPTSQVYRVAGNDYFFSNIPGSGYHLIRANGPNGAVDISNGQALPELPFQIAGSGDNNLYFLSNVVTNPFLGTTERRILHFDGNAYTSFSVPSLVHSEQSYGLNFNPYIPYEINFGGGQLLLKGDPYGDGSYGTGYGIYVLWRFEGTSYHEIHQYSPDPWYAVWNSTPPVTQSSREGALPASEIFVRGDKQYFFGFVPGSGYHLFELDGTHPAVDRTPGIGLPTLPTDLVRLGPDLFFIDGTGDLLRFDGANYSPLPGPFESLSNLRSVDGKLYFNAHPPGNPGVTDLWGHEGSLFPAFTRIVDGTLLEDPLIVSPTDRSLFFTARVPGSSETHLYSYDGGAIRDLFLHRNLTVVGTEFLQTDFALYLNAQVPGATGHDAYRFGLANVVIDEGETAHFSGTWFDPGLDDVSLGVDYGSIVQNPDGTWDWSFDSTDGPDESRTVTVTATDSDGATSTRLIHLTVRNVAPGLNLDHDSVAVYYKASATNSGTWSDVGLDDVTLGANLGSVTLNLDGTWSWSIDTLAAGLSVGTHVVTVTATDSDGAVTTKIFDLVISPRAILYTPGPVQGTGFSPAVSIGNTLFYAGITPDGGIELWKNVNGSTTPELVKDIFPGSYYSYYTNSFVAFSSNPRSFTEMGGILYFVADDATYGTELWRSDGTDAGTYVVKDVFPGVDSSNVGQLYAYQGSLYFSAYDPAHSAELWKSDGTEAGTNLFVDIVPGPSGYGYPGNFFEFQGRLWFTAYSSSGASYQDLWSTDGTPEGTRLDIHSSSLYGIVSVVPTAEKLYIKGYSGYYLFASDGTEGGTSLLVNPGTSSPYLIQGMQAFNGSLIFSAFDLSVGGYRLWASDGTSAGTSTLGSVVPDPYGPAMVELNGSMYFIGDDGVHGKELWKTDGTAAGTELVFDSLPGTDASSYYNLFVANGKLFFATSDYVVGGRLFVSDGTAAGTEEYVPLGAPSPGTIASPNFTMHMDRLYYWSYSYDAPHTQIELYATADTFPLPPNEPPVVASDAPSVTVDEGTLAQMTGTFSDPTGAAVTFSADFGTVIRTGASTWAWSWSTVGAPPSPVTVTITADDHRGGITQSTFDVLLNNVAPSVAPDQPSVTTTEGGSPTLTGTWSDPGADPVTLSASVGSIVKHPDGTWSWEWTGANHPANLLTVVITAEDGDGGVSTTTFDVMIDNVAPSYLRVHSGSIPENGIYHLVGSFYDPGEFNTHTLYIDWSDGSLLETVILPVGARTFDITHQYLDDAPSSWFVDVLPIGIILGDGREGAAFLDPPTSNLVAWYKGEHNAVDSTMYDLSLPYHGYLNNGVGFTPGMVGEAFDFDGIDDYVTAPSDYLPSGNADRTVSLWVRMDNVVAPEAFFAGYGSFGAYGQAFMIGASGTSLFFSNWGAGIAGGTLTLGQWHHVTVTLQSSYATLYLDGNPVAEGLLGIDTPVGWAPFVMGSIPGSHGDIRKLDGALDDVEVYNTPLNGAQIQSIYNSGLTGLEAAVHLPYVAVENVAPAFEAGPGEALPVGTFNFSRTGIPFTDPGSLDTFSGTVDFGDGTGPQSLTIDSVNRTFDLIHIYPAYGLYTVTVTINDDDGGTHTDSFNVTVKAPNHNPILDIDGSPTLDPISINQSTVGNPGTLISELIARMAPDGGISDVDPGDLQGIGINGADNSHGQWQYSIDGGFNWGPVGNANNDQARLLAADALTRLRFVPNTGFGGEAKIAFVAWDQTQGTNGGLGVTKNRIGTSPFSALYEFASIFVANTAPILDADGSPLFDPIHVNVPNEQNPGTLVDDLIARMSPLGGISDSYSGAPLGIAVNGLSNTSNGLWQFTVNNGTNWYPIGTTGNTNARLLYADGNTRIRFVPNFGFRGEVKIAFVAWDRTSGANGGVADVRARGGITPYSLAYEYASLFIINQAPVLTVSGTAHLDAVPRNISDAINTGTLVSSLIARMGPGGGISDADASDQLGIAINGLGGTSTGIWEFTTDGGTSWTPFGATGNSNGRLLAANALTRIRYRPNPGFFGTVRLAFVGWDGTSGLNGGVAAVGTRGGSTPYSTLYDYASLSIS